MCEDAERGLRSSRGFARAWTSAPMCPAKVLWFAGMVRAFLKEAVMAFSVYRYPNLQKSRQASYWMETVFKGPSFFSLLSFNDF